jgi:hypothetical protein
MTRPEPTACAIIETIEDALTIDRTPATRHRYARARARLEAYLESLGGAMLTDAGASMLEVERALDPDGALLRVATAEDLVYALPGFISLERPRLPVSDVRAQLRLAEQCRRFIERRGLVDFGAHACAMWEVDGALRRARAALRSG